MLWQAASRQGKTANGTRIAHLLMNVQNMFAQAEGEKMSAFHVKDGVGENEQTKNMKKSFVKDYGIAAFV